MAPFRKNMISKAGRLMRTFFLLHSLPEIWNSNMHEVNAKRISSIVPFFPVLFFNVLSLLLFSLDQVVFLKFYNFIAQFQNC